MPAFALHVADPSMVSHPSEATEFYWSSGHSTFAPGVPGPALGVFGGVPSLNVDAVRLAVGAYAADRSVPRKYGGSNWNSRQMSLQVPVSNAAIWSSASKDLESLLAFLTGDSWQLTFVEETAAPEDVTQRDTALERVVLLSGGADSVVGALMTRYGLVDPAKAYGLISHYSAGPLSEVQKTVASKLVALKSKAAMQHHVQVHLARRKTALNGSKYGYEPSSRSRSFMFITLGLALASIDGVQLWIPENGFASLNPPLGADRLGSLSTKTTHPAFLSGLAAVLSKVGAHADLHNPFAAATKGEMFSEVKALLGVDGASDLLSATNSCAHTGHPGPRSSSAVACGVCFGCTMRRASFLAADIPDNSIYADASSGALMKSWVRRKSIVQPARNFASRGVRPTDLLAMSLPEEYELEDAIDLCRRGVKELKEYLFA